MKPVLLDLFCGAGGATRGYQEAGFYVVGVDLNPQPHYVGDEFYQADALAFLQREQQWNFDAIHASPPCQAWSAGNRSHRREYPMLIDPLRALLVAHDCPTVIENVEGAPLHDPVVLCGTQFGLSVPDLDGTEIWLRRHRLFEINNAQVSAPSVPHRCSELSRSKQIAGVYGGGSFDRRQVSDQGRGGYVPTVRVAVRLMQCEWMTFREATQAIPPAYTRWLGQQIMEQL